MPKPLRKKPAPKKSTTRKKPASDPNLRAHQMMAEHMALVHDHTTVTPPHGDPTFEAQFKARMRELGSKGGKIGGKRRLVTMSPQERSEIALAAANKRWANERKKKKKNLKGSG